MYSCIFVQNYSIFFDDASKKMFLKYFNVISKFDFNYTMSRARIIIAYGVVENVAQPEIIASFQIKVANSGFKL